MDILIKPTPYGNRKKVCQVTAIIIVFLASSTAASFYLFRPSMRARSVLSQVSALQVGKSGFLDAQHIASQIGATSSDFCSPAYCSWGIRIDNLALPEQWRGPGAAFMARFQVRNSLVTEQGFMFQIGDGENAQTAEFDEQDNWPNFPKQFIVGTQTTDNNPHYRSFVKLTPALPADVRQRYLSFDFNCLWKYGRCKNAQELLPTVEWK